MSSGKMRIFYVDAFASELFKGNAAAVCVTEKPINETLMQDIAREMNLSETAFVTCKGEKSFDIRWFTPKNEMDLCGHATMAAARVLFDFYNVTGNCIRFNSRSGTLYTYSENDDIMLDFPLDEVDQELDCSKELLDAIGLNFYFKAVIGKKTRKLVLHIEDRDVLMNLKPDFAKLSDVKFEPVVKGLGITAGGVGKYDFLVRYFNPWAGVNEDPVTGSVHTFLADYWSRILNKNELISYQASERGGEVRMRMTNNRRVELLGKAIVVAERELLI